MGNTNINCCSSNSKQPEQEMDDPPKLTSHSNNNPFQNTTTTTQPTPSRAPPTHIFLSSPSSLAPHSPESILKCTKIQNAFKTHLSLTKLHSLFLQRKQSVITSLLTRSHPSSPQSFPSEQYYLHLLSEYKVYPYQQTQYYITNHPHTTKYSFSLPNAILSEDGAHVYIGSFNINEQYNGYGVLYDLKGRTRLEGIWHKGVLNGYGRLFTEDKEYAVGNFRNNLLNGESVYYYYKDGSVFNGEFVNGVPNGAGRISYEDGSVFEGSFVNGEKVYGKFMWSDGKYYQGDIKGELFEGYGVYEWGGNRRYEGEWKSGKMEGKGKISYVDGTYYEGMFQDNQRTGFGKYVWNEKKWYEGEWKNGKQNGSGVYFKNGVLMKGIWENGSIVKDNKKHKVKQRRSAYDGNKLLSSENNSIMLSSQEMLSEEQISSKRALANSNSNINVNIK